jgi:serine/threonine protein kinase
MSNAQQTRRTSVDAPSTTGRITQVFGNAKHDKHTEAGFKERYSLGRVLGSGAFSTVRLAVDRSTGKEWACKVVNEEAERAVLLREVDILQQLDHPNLLQYRDHFNTPDTLYIITELLEGSDLLAAVLERGSYSEEDAREIIHQMLSALSFLDSKGVAHRDLKMENIVLATAAGGTRVKIIDFGLADQLSKGKSSFREACGTPMYLAPEVASRVPYGTSCDVWAAGVVLFMLLSGDYPFQGNSVSELVKKILQAQLRFKDPVWQITSPGAMDLVKTLLTANPAERATAEEALAHPWLVQQ